MEAATESWCKVPINEKFECELCNGPLCGVLREPPHASACDHTFCRLCRKAALSKEACCPNCKEPGDASEPLAVDTLMVKCPNGDGWAGRLGAVAAHRTEGASRSGCSASPFDGTGVGSGEGSGGKVG